MGRTFTKEELNKVLEKHAHYVLNDCEGCEDMRADLCGANLNRVDFSGALLCKANLHEAHLSGANFYGANLSKADLILADLSGANLNRSSFHGANLRGANLNGSSLHGADLSGANLYGVYIYETSFYGADLRGAKNVPFIPMACPDTGSFTGWKKGLAERKDSCRLCEVIIELVIPEDARRSSATTSKCRCDRAIVKSITSIEGPESFDMAFSRRDNEFIYKVGETVSVSNFDEDRFNECAPGIHFFINRQEAVDY